MEVKTIAVVGAGTMGRGIAYAASLGGFQTILEDLDDSVLAKAMDWIQEAFDEGVKRGKVEASARDAGDRPDQHFTCCEARPFAMPSSSSKRFPKKWK